MRKSQLDFSELNNRFSIDRYLDIDDQERIDFRLELKNCIKALQKEHKLKMMTKEDLVLVGMRLGNRTAMVINILTEKLTPYNYDQTFHFKDTIAILWKHLLEELYGRKSMFYDLGEGAIGLDQNYTTFLLGKKFSIT